MIVLTTRTRCRIGGSVQIELPRPNMIIDPRAYVFKYFTRDRRDFKFECIYHDNGTTVTLTRLLDDERVDVETTDGPFDFRVYDPEIETVPDFTSTIYIYMGVDRERAPADTTVLFIHSSVNTIQKFAFRNCETIKKCFMHDGVNTIEEYSFNGCIAMKVIRLSRTLKWIGEWAFSLCFSLEAVFLPPSIEKVERSAFFSCLDLRILSLPLGLVDVSQLGRNMLGSCSTFFEVTQKQEYHQFLAQIEWKHEEVNQVVLDFYRRLPPLHKACLDTNVTSQSITDAIAIHGPPARATSVTSHGGMTPLHILAMNPHADVGSTMACFDANMSCALVGDNRGRTVLDYLLENDKLNIHTTIVAYLCVHLMGDINL